MDDRRLFWAAKNRSRPDRTRDAGRLVGELAQELGGVHGDLSDIAATLGPMVDEEFRRHCRVGAIRSGSLVLYVDEPTMGAMFRQRWSAVLPAMLRGEPGLTGVRKIVFEFARGGASLLSW